MAYRFLRYPGGKSKAVTFSYDDGCKSDMRLAETLDKYSIKCTFNLNSTKLFKGTDLTVEDAKQLIQNGHEVAIHGANHIACGIASPITGIKDVITCRTELEKALGTIIRGMAYPDTGITAFSNGTNYTMVK
ncbi:MAG: polysaccharide deacetylase family protein, partial [Clostridia bacterium]|nr:polysaccharide deacetylase family protein [Clostridia bacterium]